MFRSVRSVSFLLAIAYLLAACAAAAAPQPASPTTANAPTAAPAPTVAPTVAPSPTPEPTFARGARIANIDVSGLTIAAATAKVQTNLAKLTTPIELMVGAIKLTIPTSTLTLQLPSASDLIAQAQRDMDAGRSVQITLKPTFDSTALSEQLDALAKEVSIEPTIGIISSTKSISRSFTYTPGATINTDKAIATISKTLGDPAASRTISLGLEDNKRPPRADFATIKTQLQLMAKGWNGIVGFYMEDLETGESIALNENTVFSGASVMKVPIMLFAYTNIISFTAKQETALRMMITDSDNYAANTMLAAGAGGFGTEDALVGALAMSDMLRDLGLKHTYQHMPYEASDYLIGVLKTPIKFGPTREGSAPFTAADRVLRSTPAEMAQVFKWIDQCSKGEGPLLEEYGENLTPKRCQEMLDRLNKNGDNARMRGGMPKGTRFEHKSGWISDMQADVGIVRSDGGDFVVALYLYSPTEFTDNLSLPILKAFGRMVYTAYNPILKTGK